MTARSLVRIAALASLAAASPAGAQERTRAELDLLHAEDRSLRDVVGEIARRSGEDIVVEEGLDAVVSIELREVSWRAALELVAERTGCDVERRPSGALIVTRPPRMEVRLVDARVRTALLMLARYAGKSVVIAPEVKGRVSLSLHDVEWTDAIRAVAGDFAVVGGGDELITVGTGAGAAPDSDAPVASGRVVRAGDAELVIERASGERLELSLPRDGARRALARETIEGLRRGDRVVCAYRAEGSQRVLESVIAPGRGGSE